MLLSFDTAVLRDRYGDETALRMIAAAGFDAYDYSMFRADGEKFMLGDDYRERAIRLRAVADELGLVCRQAHAPFNFEYDDVIDISAEKYLHQVRSLEIASILGAENIVVHTVKRNLPDDFDLEGFSYTFYRSFIPYCERFNMHISVENLVGKKPITNEKFPVFSNPQQHLAFVESLDSEWFNICIDLGHSALLGYAPQDVIASMNKTVFRTMHVHDNDFLADSHVLPYDGKMDWEAILRALARVDFQGDFSFELEGYLKPLSDEEMPRGLEKAARLGREMIQKINAYKEEYKSSNC